MAGKLRGTAQTDEGSAGERSRRHGISKRATAIYCQLCGVSFAINRFRKRGEPRSAAWADSSASTRPEASWGTYSPYYGCPRDGDRSCSLVHRGLQEWQLKQRRSMTHRLYENDPEDGIRKEDPTYEPANEHDDDDDEPLEYSSGSSTVDGQDGSDEVVDVVDEDASSEGAWQFSVKGPPLPEFDAEFLPLSAIDHLNSDVEDEDEDVDYQTAREQRRQRADERGEYEHIAGPDCQHTSCYNGNNISVEQMADCMTAQCLLVKPDNWAPRPDDMDFEATSRYFLTGLAGNVPSGGDGMKFAPARHGCARGKTDNDDNCWITTEEEQRESGVAFHPACFEIFTVASNSVFGKVDVDGLVRLRNLCCEGKVSTFCEWPEEVTSCREQVWDHQPGSEYLAANPLFIPGFRAICERAMNQGEAFDVRRSPFEARQRVSGGAANSTDPFLKLPAELVQKIVRCLDSRDIAAMRASSRAFEHLPISLWHRLLVDEMPFLYEARHDDATPYDWACQDVQLLQKLRVEEEEWDRERRVKARELEDSDPDAHGTYLALTPEKPPWHEGPGLKKMLHEALARKKALGPIALPHDKTNWYQLYRDIVANWRHLLGLQNRERIWATVYDICERIKDTQDGDQVMTGS
ncbi:E3 ubiquitin-protein ligase BRE1 [Purpureocillium lavendulum]|uniref:E3 ubiquitin-protein ligase BRE1 n=1 Tax=Purpureocillium lavendulum TaxID=1247861 RepID=A0AB34G4S3_9HYPO|nr:E3 ubiquitin-protein ligase BRE1 [Purpureocillium lavendulum]